MLFYYSMLGCVGLMVMPISSFAKVQKLKPQPLLSKIQKAYSAIKSFQADVLQKQASALFADQQEISKGVLYFQKPYALKWEMTEGSLFTLISDQKQAWYYTPPSSPQEKGQVLKSPIPSLQLELMMALFSGQFKTKFFKNPQTVTSVSVLWKPSDSVKKMLPHLHSISLKVDPKTYLAKDIELTYQGPVGFYKTVIHFLNLTTHKIYPKAFFVFQTPPNTVEVVSPKSPSSP